VAFLLLTRKTKIKKERKTLNRGLPPTQRSFIVTSLTKRKESLFKGIVKSQGGSYFDGFPCIVNL